MPRASGLVERLAALDRRMDELTRTGHDVAPLCVVHLGVDVVAWPNERMDIQPVTSWDRVADTDPRGMWHYNQGDDSWIQIPCAGRYRIVVNSRWAPPGVYNASVPNSLSTSVLLNGTIVAGNGIAETTAYHLPDATTAYTLVSEDHVFATGDRLRVNFWSRWPNVRLVAATAWNTTHMVVRYLGSQ